MDNVVIEELRQRIDAVEHRTAALLPQHGSLIGAGEREVRIVYGSQVIGLAAKLPPGDLVIWFP